MDGQSGVQLLNCIGSKPTTLLFACSPLAHVDTALSAVFIIILNAGQKKTKRIGGTGGTEEELSSLLPFVGGWQSGGAA
jgi:hypothetical protein